MAGHSPEWRSPPDSYLQQMPVASEMTFHPCHLVFECLVPHFLACFHDPLKQLWDIPLPCARDNSFIRTPGFPVCLPYDTVLEVTQSQVVSDLFTNMSGSTMAPR